MLLMFFDVMHEMGDLGRGTYRLKEVAAYVLLSAPMRLHEAAPIAVLIGTLFAVANLVATSEYVVMRASGLSLIRLCATLSAIGIVFATIASAFGEFVAPPLQQLAQQLRSQAVAGIVAHEFRSGLWVKDGHTFVNVRQVTPQGKLINIVIYDFDDTQKLLRMSAAQDGQYAGERSWTLNDVLVTTYEASRAIVQHMPKVTWTSVLEPRLLSMLMVEPGEMSAWNLYSYSEFLKANQQNAGRYVIALWMKVVYPLSIVMMMLLALAFARAQRRSGGAGARVFTGIMLGLTYILLNRLFATFATLYDWPPAAGALLPTLLFFGLAATMLVRQERT